MEDWTRAGDAARWLTDLANSGPVLAVTHGVIRQMIGEHLLADGWRAKRLGGYRHWSAWRFES
jgi:hypothetical protein